MLFRKATLKDLDGLRRLRGLLANDPDDKKTKEYAPYSEVNDTAWVARCLRSRIKPVLVAEQDGCIIAHAIIVIETVPKRMQPYCTYRKKARLIHLLVDENRRRQGIGQALMKYMLKYLKEQGAEFVDLDCYMYNKKAAALYAKVGFKDVFVTKRFIFK